MRALYFSIAGRLLALSLLGVTAWAAAELLTSPQFVVSRVLVRGHQLVNTDDIVRAINVEGLNVFRLRGSRLDRIVAQDPLISQAHILPRLPDAVEVVIQERAPSAIWETEQRQFLVDAEGLVLREIGVAERARDPLAGLLDQLYAISAPDGPGVEPGGRVDADAIYLAQSLGPRLDALGLTGARVEFRPAVGVSLAAPDGRRVAIGASDNLEAKLDAYLAIRRQTEIDRTPAQLIDVRFLLRPYFR